jgi:two-component system response regulator GlrR
MARVMLVEDDPVTCAAITVRLRRHQHHVLAVESAESALASIATLGLPDVAIVDVGLPGRDGLTLLELLRQQMGPHPLGVIVISAGPCPDPDRLTESTRTRFLPKPIPTAALLAAVNEVWAGPTPAF